MSGAAFTTVDEAVDDSGHCLNGNPGVNCNIYDGKEFVWANGGPAANGLGGEGDYFFAVLVPGGQGGGDNPNDGTEKNLSDDFDAYTNRTFTVGASGEVTAYGGSHWFDSGAGAAGSRLGAPDNTPPFIRLSPYADTTNPGGVYIMAICSLEGDLDPDTFGSPGVDPSECKYDAFKIREATPPGMVASCFSGSKYRDDNKDGDRDAGEIGLAGWKISINPGAIEVTTNGDGDWSWCEPAHEPASGTTDYTVAEVQQTGWKQTGNTTDQSIAINATVSLLNKVYTVTVPNDGNATADLLLFGNIPQGTVTGAKYYDANLNGVLGLSGTGPFSALEALISGWKINQAGAASALITTGSSGTDGNGYPYNFTTTLDPGTYTFTEQVATGWIQTGNTSAQGTTTGGATSALASKAYTVVIPNDQPSSVSGVYFGNVCLGAGGGLTLGFWSNKNGQALVGSDDLALLSSLNLKNGTGGDFNPTAYSQLKSWLLNATATNMAYMLSAQLAAMELNVYNGKVSGTAIVWGGSTLGFITINALMSAANTELGLHPLTVAPSADRTYQEQLKNALDGANNNLNFVQSAPCANITFP